MAGGMANMQQMMRKMQKMQKQVEASQKELEAKEFTGKEPSGMVTATLTGDKKLKAIDIKADAVDPDDVDMLEDLVIAAVNDGLDQVEKETNNMMGQYTKGIPGL
ncbi:YbaB/EbfC family nucleoid-associated protein [Aerococcus kribbianus]|uniref:Nucleoid-associated protein OW157_06425 n=1 Tax=Aerococcus kribbianus TaxID=2999064 RepID=A0A9X3FQ31_9LACT|nr:MULTISPECIES: YbaB/EbfC family nucleoid-associated protein [unclassified Aerococcus]MCZ0717909.1 YbaB/EbfC family nucleoid-associated protein [Aerococcus sp. YH-aer221]MCZ0726196.1 YbaB/EbfC family nucleoid-associated protein [Aerococcus sp. YH-aer222]